MLGPVPVLGVVVVVRGVQGDLDPPALTGAVATMFPPSTPVTRILQDAFRLGLLRPGVWFLEDRDLQV